MEEIVLLSPRSLKELNIKPSQATLKVVISLLQTSQIQRSSKQINLLQALTRKIKFFTQKVEELGESVHFDSCRFMTYQFLSAGSFVFESGSIGDKFYIIILGTASVIVPVSKDNRTEMIPVAKLNTGTAFGELALLKNQPRAASIQCLTDCHFAVLSKQDYMKIIGKAESKILEKKIQFLKEISFFSKWSKMKLEKLTYYFSIKTFARNQVVFSKGAEASHVFIVKSGEFELTKPLLLESSEKKYTIKVALLGPGEIIGDDEVITKEAYKNTCVCYSGTGEMMILTAQNFLLKFYQKPEGGEVFKRLVKQQIREERVKNFRNFLNTGKKEERDAESPYVEERRAKSRIRLKSETIKTCFSPLNREQIEKIKRKALGFCKKEKVYIDFHTPLTHNCTEGNERSVSPKGASLRSAHEMRAHQPGGYYRSKLKRPKILISDLTLYLK